MRFRDISEDEGGRHDDVSEHGRADHDDGGDIEYAHGHDHERDFWGALSAQQEQEAHSQNDAMSQYDALSQHGAGDMLHRGEANSYGQKRARTRTTRGNTARRLFAGNDEEEMEYSDRHILNMQENGGTSEDMSVSYGRNMQSVSGVCVCVYVRSCMCLFVKCIHMCVACRS